MRHLLLPFFTVMLLIKTAPTFFTLLTKKLLPYRSIIISFLILNTVLIILFISLSTPLEKTHSTSSESNLIEQKNKLENLLQKQPTHRDILLNLAKINQALDNEQQSINLEKKALSLDPNNNLFQKR